MQPGRRKEAIGAKHKGRSITYMVQTGDSSKIIVTFFKIIFQVQLSPFPLLHSLQHSLGKLEDEFEQVAVGRLEGTQEPCE